MSSGSRLPWHLPFSGTRNCASTVVEIKKNCEAILETDIVGCPFFLANTAKM